MNDRRWCLPSQNRNYLRNLWCRPPKLSAGVDAGRAWLQNALCALMRSKDLP